MNDEGDKVTVYEDAAGEFRWRRVAQNGEIVSESGEGYTDRGHALRMAQTRNEDATIDDQTSPA